MSNCMNNPNNKCCGGACLSKNSQSIITWAEPKCSAIAMGSILITLLLVKLVNLPALFFRLSTYALLGAGLAEYAGKIITGTGFISRFKPKTKNYAGQVAEYYAPHVVTILKNVEIQAQALYTAANVEGTVRAGIVSFFLYKLTSIFSLWTLIFLGTILTFTVPPVYLAKKTAIDNAIANLLKLVKAKTDEGVKVVNDKYGPQIEKAKNTAAPLLNMLGSKQTVRTAGTTVDEPSTTSPSAPATASTTSAAPVDEVSSIKKVNVPTTLPTEVDFNALGEQLKQEATAATADADVYTREKVDHPAQL